MKHTATEERCLPYRLADLRAQSPSLTINPVAYHSGERREGDCISGRCERVASFEHLTLITPDASRDNHRCRKGTLAAEERSLILMLMGVHGIAEHRTFGPVLMRVTMSKRHIAYVKTAYSPCQFGIGRMSRLNFISDRANKEGRLSVVTPLVPSLFKSLASRAEVTSF